MKHISSIIAGSLVAILMSGASAARLQAQIGAAATFSVPFAFSADGQSIAAGTYQLNLVSNDYMMSIRNVETGATRFLSVHPEQQRTIAARGVLVFHVCGERRVLAEFHIPGTDIYSKTITPRRMKQEEAKTCPAPDLTVASR